MTRQVRDAVLRDSFSRLNGREDRIMQPSAAYGIGAKVFVAIAAVGAAIVLLAV